MSWSYSGDPAASAKDAVRFAIGDTDGSTPKAQLLSDEEIAYLLTGTGQNVGAAALQAISNIMAKWARLVDETTGPVSRSFSQRLKNMATLRADLELRLSLDGGGAGYVGGISNSDIQSNRQDGDWNRPSFSQRMGERPPLDARGRPYAPFLDSDRE